ncbi:FecR family protein [Ulvibacterium sp.]|uniref:FecR family protein n=1 Tax=Ulvibacterium sp. TaxID=2665914 RepID=UPI003BAC69C8
MEKLIIKYLTDKASPSEIEALEKWIQLEGNDQIFEEYVRINFLANNQAVGPDIEGNKAKLIEYAQRKRRVYRLGRVKTVFKYAAIFVALVALSFYGYDYFYSGSSVIGDQEADTAQPALIIADEDIILKNDKGEIQVLDEKSKSNIVHNSQGRQVAQQNGAQINYHENEDTAQELVYNEIFVPYGKRFQVTLSDGTLVHLNSGTSLKFPINFIAGQERGVFLKGEAFFEVTKHKSDAFVIHSGDLGIQVLGTKFNVSSYEEDQRTNTVLVEGSVQVYDTSKPDSKVVLKTGEMATHRPGQNQIAVQTVNTDLYTAWMDGRLILRKMPFKLIRKKLERHYNVTIVNHNKDLDEATYNVNFDNETIEQVLKVLNENFKVDYEITNNQIIIN